MFTRKSNYAPLVAALCSAAMLVASAAPHKQRKINVETGQAQSRERLIRVVAEAAEDEIAFSLSAATPKMIVILAPDQKGPIAISRGAVFVPLGKYQTSPTLEVRIVTALLLRRAQEERRRAGLRPENMPQWIVAAFVYRTWQKIARAAPSAWYPASRQLAMAGQSPDLMTLTSTPISPELPLLYRLYADVCACTLRCVYNARVSSLTNLLTTEADSQFDAIALELKRPKSAIQPWFERAFPALALGNPVPTRLDHLKESIAEALDSGAKGGEGKPLRVDQAMERIPGFKLTLEQRKTYFANILQVRLKAPPLLAPAIDEFVEACKLLVEEKDWRARRKFRNTQDAFDKAWDRAYAIQKFLISHERGMYSNAHKIDRMLKDNPVTSAQELEWEKRLRRYLDSYEKKLEDAFITPK